MTMTPDGELTRDPHVEAEVPRRSGSTIWTESLTESERSIIENVLREGNLSETRRWLRFCLKILDEQKR